VAYVVPEPGQNLKASELVATLKGQLPGYMVPAAFVLMDSFPLTSRGKLDHQALPAPEWAGGGTGAADLAPRNATEERLVAIWMEVLGLEQVGLRDNFFDLGGHSLLAVRLLAKIEVEFETRIPLLTLLNEGTVEGLARMLGGGPSPAGRQAIVPLRSGHEARPLFVVTAGYGDLLALGQMAAQLPLGLPVFGLQPPGEGDGSPPVQDLAELTGHYVRAIREQQPEGPYRLAGYCSGGLVAFEVARQLTAGGDEVEPLILMESPRSLSRGSIAFYRRLRPVIARLIPGPNYDRFRPVAILRALFADQGLMAHLEALAGYRVANYPGQLTLILARWSHLRWFVGPRRWRRVAGRGLQVHIVPGDHDNFLRGPRSMSLAEKLTELIL
jgi:thioesterase domain-containing protein/acyl carrier protein